MRQHISERGFQQLAAHGIILIHFRGGARPGRRTSPSRSSHAPVRDRRSAAFLTLCCARLSFSKARQIILKCGLAGVVPIYGNRVGYDLHQIR
jgi:hypothetical protein